MKRDLPPPSSSAVARLPDLERMGEITLTDSGVSLRLRSGQVQLWRRMPGSKWLERVVP